jgi:hypothetical protein
MSTSTASFVIAIPLGDAGLDNPRQLSSRSVVKSRALRAHGREFSTTVANDSASVFARQRETLV